MSKHNPFDFVFLLRPILLIPCWNFLLIGSYRAQGGGGFSGRVLLGLVIYTFVMGGIYILNQIMDVETDRINKKLFLLSEGYIPIKYAYLEMLILWIVAIFLSLKFDLIFLLFILISIIMGIMYSVPPIKLKGKPIVDTLSNGLGYGMINLGVGWLLVQPFAWHMFYRFIPYFLSLCAFFINTTIVDIEGDRRAHELTTAIFLGGNVASIISTILMIGGVVTAYILKDLVCLIPTAVSLPLYIYVAVKTSLKNTIDRKSTIASFRLHGLLFTVMTAFLYPLYFLVLIVVFVSMRFYYKSRFGMVYPTLSQG